MVDRPDEALFVAAAAALVEQSDAVDGGFGSAPKFPQTFAIDTLLRHHLRTGAPDSLAAALLCLEAMATGGFFDHLGGGFARDATDRRWLGPHFEKMLYDQALLIRVYVHAWQITGEDRYAQVVRESIAYVLRDLRDPAGGFHSAEDADSEGVEGRFYVWTLDEVVDVCGDDADAVIEWFGITAAGNWEGVTILERPVRDGLIRPPAVTRGCAALFATRATRVRPGLDDKVLTEWNALMISTLAEAGAALGEPTWIEVAVEAGLFLLEELRKDGRWMRTWQGRAHIPAFSADHAALVDAFVRLHEATGDPRWIDEAIVTADTLLDLFADPAEPGVFTSGVDAERLIARPKEFMDNATACANSLAAVALLRLSALTGDERHRDAARAIVDHTLDAAVRIPLGFGHLLLAAELDLLGTTEIVVTGDRPELLAEVRRRYLPGAVVSWGGPIAGPLWEGRDERGAEGRAHVCRDMVCALPATTLDELRQRLDALN
ncbi:MAG: thioredoxin domain-containing protein, partial [Actinomycetales bacterium]